MRHIVIDTSGNIVNAIEWNGVSLWTPPSGTFTMQNSSMDIGGTYISGVYTPPVQPPAVHP